MIHQQVLNWYRSNYLNQTKRSLSSFSLFAPLTLFCYFLSFHITMNHSFNKLINIIRWQFPFLVEVTLMWANWKWTSKLDWLINKKNKWEWHEESLKWCPITWTLLRYQLGNVVIHLFMTYKYILFFIIINIGRMLVFKWINETENKLKWRWVLKSEHWWELAVGDQNGFNDSTIHIHLHY